MTEDNIWGMKFKEEYPNEVVFKPTKNPEIPKSSRVEAKNKEKGIEVEETKEESKHKGIKINKLNRLTKVIKLQPKKILFSKNKAVIVIPKREIKPILRRSEIFEKEYEREKNILSWK